MTRKNYHLIVAAVVAVVLSVVSVAHAQGPDERCKYYYETEHYVCGKFLEYYSSQGDLEIFGYPLSEAYYDPDLELEVQYFQNSRIEYHPENSEPYNMLLGLLVDDLDIWFPPAPEEKVPRINNDLHHYFSETGHLVEYVFFDYFRAKGGLDIFGYPRSEYMLEDGNIVQYFQRARMEYHPEITNGQKMHLAPLGEITIDVFSLTGPPFDPAPPPSRVEPIPTELNVTASVRYVVTGQEGGQTVYVYVADQNGKPVEGAQVSMVVGYPSGDQFYQFDEPTDSAGFAGYYFDLPSTAAGEKVVITVTATYASLSATTRIFFFAWW
jgi:hypothetical protein